MAIYTHDVAAHILEEFDDTLCELEVIVPSPEDDEREPDNDCSLYGSVYSDLLDKVEEILISILKEAKVEDVVPYTFSGNY